MRDIFSVSDLNAEREHLNKPYLEFLRMPSLSAGIYVLPAGAIDAQKPHTEDELYYIVSGRGFVRVETEDRAVQPGAIIFVRAGLEHRFHTITETLTLFVIFGPAEGSLATTQRQ